MREHTGGRGEVGWGGRRGGGGGGGGAGGGGGGGGAGDGCGQSRKMGGAVLWGRLWGSWAENESLQVIR